MIVTKPMASSADQSINFYMPSIYWHDRASILCIDVLQQNSAQKRNGQPVYKMATASMQKEIRVWNFTFDPVAAEPTNVPQTKQNRKNAVPITAPLVMVPKPDELTPACSHDSEGQSKKPDQDDEDNESIKCLDDPDPEKENEVEVLEKDEEEVKMETDVIELKVDEVVKAVQAEVEAKKQKKALQQSLSVEFLSNIEGHRFPTNVVKFSPNGAYIASGDADGFLFVWRMDQQSEAMEAAEAKTVTAKHEAEAKRKQGDPEMDIPPNKESWVRAFRIPIRHDGDVTALAWSPDSQMVASVSMDDSVAVHRADSGKRVWAVRGFRHFANGIVWDPRGKYLITLSSDRRMDVLDAQKGTRLRCCHQIELPTTPLPQADGIELVQQSYKLFHDDQLLSFQRGIEISPCGSVVFAPAVHLEVGPNNIYGTFAFLRASLNSCRPSALFPTIKPTIHAKCSPVLYKLEDGPNFLGLPHRLIFAILCRDSVLLYNSQCESPFAYIENIQYDKLTSLAWTPDGRVLVVSSLEGYNSFITVDSKKVGEPCEQQADHFVNMNAVDQQQQLTETGKTPKSPTKLEPSSNTPMKLSSPKQASKTPTPQHPLPPISLPDSPKLITPRRPRAKKAVLNTPSTIAAVADGSTPKASVNQQQQEKRPLLSDESPKTIIPRKKPKKIKTTPVPTTEVQGGTQ